MDHGRDFLCTSCQAGIPLTGFETMADNPVANLFWGLLPIRNATAFIWYAEGSGFRDIVHRFKYSGQWSLARDLGRWFGRTLADTDAYAGVDLIVPVPLHPLKKIRRGYNQSDYIADGMAAEMDVSVDTGAIVRRVNNGSQTEKHGAERWKNVEGIFAVIRPERLAGRHILLVDDVLTTGATISSCAEAIIAAVPDCHISIATLYASQRLLGIRG